MSEFQTKTFLSNLILYYNVVTKMQWHVRNHSDGHYKLGNMTYENIGQIPLQNTYNDITSSSEL